jgi:hypothetical protein
MKQKCGELGRVRRVLIAMKQEKQCDQIKNILHSHFRMKSHGGSRVFDEEMLRWHLGAHRQSFKRQQIFEPDENTP